jgi:hypothetical protein
VPGIALIVEPALEPAQTVARGAWRLPENWPDQDAPRKAVFLIAIGRRSRLQWSGYPGADAVSFVDDLGERQGWFNVSLGECCDLPDEFEGTLDVTAVLGELRSVPAEVSFAING